MKPKFIEGGKKNGHDEKVLEKIWADWEKFASYVFNKSHAACYSWVAYQTAYLKAHYPAEFMAALLTRRRSDIKEITKLMDECKALGIPTLGPDVNESYTNFGVNKKGEIRFGLSAIKGISEAATLAIIKVREENGPFRDIYDLLERVPASAMNKKALECLALSGALDNFGIAREQYVSPAGKYSQFIDMLSNYAQQYQSAKSLAVNSLFGDFDSVEINRPKPDPLVPWSAIEKLNRERELVGIYLSAHPLDEFAVVLECMCNTKCSEIGKDADRAELAKKDTLTIGGIVTNVNSRYTKTGKPMGVVSIEDFEGVGELAMFGEDWARWQGMFQNGCSVYVKMKSQERFQKGSGIYDLKIQSVDFLQDVSEKFMESLTVHIDMDSLTTDSDSEEEEAMTENVLSDLATIISETPGKTKLFFSIRDNSLSTMPVNLVSGLPGVKVNRQLVDYVKSHEGLSITM